MEQALRAPCHRPAGYPERIPNRRPRASGSETRRDAEQSDAWGATHRVAAAAADHTHRRAPAGGVPGAARWGPRGHVRDDDSERAGGAAAAGAIEALVAATGTLLVYSRLR